jgi:hypothetical protein
MDVAVSHKGIISGNYIKCYPQEIPLYLPLQRGENTLVFCHSEVTPVPEESSIPSLSILAKARIQSSPNVILKRLISIYPKYYQYLLVLSSRPKQRFLSRHQLGYQPNFLVLNQTRLLVHPHRTP